MEIRKKKKYGVTDCVSSDPPTDQEIALTDGLIKTLKSYNFFETEEEGLKRELVLGKLSIMLNSFVRKVGRQLDLPATLVSESRGKLFTFGSYRLGVHDKGADIDVLCVVPYYVTSVHFFTIFYDMLKENQSVRDVIPLKEAYVPLIKFVYDEFPIDLTFAQLKMPVISDNLDLLKIDIPKFVDARSIVSINGSRTTDEILGLVPSVSVFHTALRCMKLWARKKGIYNNSMGYIGGVACAILVARICQMYPTASVSKVISRFFYVYSTWKWPNPIMLKTIEYHIGQHKVWNPRDNAVDRAHKMPIITPAYPSICSTHNVSQSTFDLMMKEIRKGVSVIDDIENGRSSWERLFTESSFFKDYRHYIQIIALTTDAEDSLMWKGYVESRIRHLTGRLEQVPGIRGAPPFYRSFYNTVEAYDEQEIPQKFLVDGGDLKEPRESHEENKDEPELKTYHTYTFYIGLGISVRKTDEPKKNLNFTSIVEDFKRSLQSDNDQHGRSILVTGIKRQNLPGFVSEDRKEDGAT